MTCWRTPRRLRGENGAKVVQAFQTRWASVTEGRGNPAHRDTTEGIPIAALTFAERRGSAAV
jgi:hypothetical protein